MSARKYMACRLDMDQAADRNPVFMLWEIWKARGALSEGEAAKAAGNGEPTGEQHSRINHA
ncbi:MAG: hypothetical protein AMXMBFR84_23170 [Candidatus Hydrogenedentota bacterium]